MPNDRYFSTGDGGRYANGSSINYEYMALAAAFYKDPALEAFARYYTNGYSKWSYTFTEELTAPMTLVFGSFFADDVPEGEYETRGDGVDLIQYYSSPNGFMSARDSWESDAAVTIMKIGEYTMFNHDIADHGTFQIYYKGMLATSSGAYNKYGSYVHKYYLQSTIAQNGLLIFNPSLADAEPVYDANGNITNAARYYYSGSQRSGTSGNTLSAWLDDGHAEMGDVTGYEIAYNADGSAKYGYIAGDITKAYDSATVNYVGRRMLTLYTGNEDYPMLFFVFDRMTSDGADFTKSFLLHTVNEPTVDKTAMSAVVTDGEGKLVLHSVAGADSIEKIGGEGYAYWINGKNCLDQYTTSDNASVIWGRIELTAVGDLTDSFLTAMYVTDAGNENYLTVEGNETSDAKFAKVLDNVVVFADSDFRVTREFSIGITGEGLYTYYVSGLEAGKWTVSVDDAEIKTVTATEESGLISFVAPAGKVTFTPGEAITNASEGKIRYNLGGGSLPSDAPTTYSKTSATALPTATRGNDIFLGWYVSEACADGEKLTEIPAGLSGSDITLYAKWRKVLAYENYEGKSFVVSGSTTQTKYDLSYNAGSTGEPKPNNNFKTATDSSGNTYIIGTASTYTNDAGTVLNRNSIIYKSDSTYNLTKMSETAISYEFDVARVASTPRANVHLCLTTSSGAYGTLSNLFNISVSKLFSSYYTTVSVRGKTVYNLSISENMTTVRVTVDFAAGTVTLYNASGSALTTQSLGTVPTCAEGKTQPSSWLEWQKVAASYIFRLELTKSAEGTTASMAFDNIKVIEGRAWEEQSTEEASSFISYNLGGGTLDETAPCIYSTVTPTALPTNVENGDKIFAGWYTTSTFDAGTRITEIPTSSSGVVNVYAKWAEPLLYENYDNTAVDVYEAAETKNKFSYNARNKACSFKTVMGADGNEYVVASNETTGSNGIIYSTSSTYNLTHFKNTSIYYEMKLKKEKDIPLSALAVNIATSGGAYGQLPVFEMNTVGAVKLRGGSVTLATVNESEFITVRVVVDFAASKLIAYDGAGKVLDTASVTTVPSGTSGAPATLLDWQKVAQSYVFYASFVTYNSSAARTSALVDDIKIFDGNPFA